MSIFQLRNEELRRFPRVMGIVNINDDSFSGDGSLDVGESLNLAKQMIQQGADIIDVGAESARTNRGPITIDEEIARLRPFIEAYPALVKAAPARDALQIQRPLLSINTWRPEVVKAVLEMGEIDIINDIGGLVELDNAQLCAGTDASLLVMHTVGEPKVPHLSQMYDDVWGAMEEFFDDRLHKIEGCGLDREQVILDPGIDFAKQRLDNLRIYAEIERLSSYDLPVLLPISRKTVIGETLGIEEPQERDAGTVACLVRGLAAGADIFRVHNVKAVADCIRVVSAIHQARPTASSM